MDSEIKFYFNEISKFPLFSKKEEISFFKRYKEGNESLKKNIIEANLRLVINIAKRHMNSDIPLIDLIQEGNLGLIKAIEKFDITRGCRFSTYAVWWIRQAITREIENNSHIIRLPVYTQEKISKFEKIKKNFISLNNREPTIKELSEELNVPLNEIHKIITFSMILNIVSFDGFITSKNTHNSIPISELIKNDNQLEQIDLITLKNIKKRIKNILTEYTINKKISKRDVNIFLKRFGIDSPNGMKTLEQTGIDFKLSRERIRQIEGDVINILKKNYELKKMHQYI